jgi:hypothetical protein
LRPDDEQRRGRRDGDEDQDERGRRFGNPTSAQVDQEEQQARGDGDELREHEPSYPELGLQAVKDELAEDRDVVPARGGDGGEGDTARNRPRVCDLPAQRGQPTRVGPHRCQQGTERGHEARDQHGQPCRRVRVRPQEVHEVSIGRDGVRVDVGCEGQRSNNAAWPWPTPTHSVANP